MKNDHPKHIVCCALPAWEADYLRSTVELMKCLSADNLVLYVDYAYTISDCIKGILGKKKFEWQRLLALKKRLRKISGGTSQGLYVLSLPPVFPSFAIKSYKYFKIANKINAAITGFYINRAIKRLKMKDIVVFNSFQPFLGLYWKIRNLKFMVYYIYDDFTNVPWFNGFVAVEEKKFIEKVDLVVVSSQELKKRKTGIHKLIEVVNNGVHFESFYNKIPKTKLNGDYIKTVGYTGTMDNRIDLDLVEFLVKEMPSIRFLFIGKIFEQRIYERLSRYINVCFEPPVNADQIPVMLAQVDAGIIPYVCNELTAAIYPLKANEYLAMGLPVIMTPFASIGDADDVVCIAKTPESFLDCLGNALNEKSNVKTQNRFAVAKKADWKARATQLAGIIAQYDTDLDKQ